MSRLLKRSFLIASAIALFGAIFPWTLQYQGYVFGMKLSLRALGDEGGALIVLVGLACLLFNKPRTALQSIADELDQSTRQFQLQTIAGFTLLYLVVAISHKLRAQSLIGTHAYDLGFFSNICWNTAHGNWFLSSEIERNFMAVHTNWILWPISFLYKVGGDAQILLVVQALFVGCTVPLLWMLVKKITGSFSAGALGALLFVCSPYVNQAVSNDFHPDLWLLPCLTASLLCWFTQRRIATVAFALLAILAKEDVSVVVCAWGIVLCFKRDWRWAGATMLTFSLAIFLFQIQVFIPQFVESSRKSLLFERYAFFGDGFTDIQPLLLLKAFFHEPIKYVRMATYLLPVAGLTCLAPSFLVPPIISLLPHLLSQASTQLDLVDIYAMPSQPFLFCGAAFGAVRLIRWVGPRFTFPVASILVVVAGIGLITSTRYFRSETKPRQHAFREMKALIPHDASLLAQQNLYPHFDTRRYIQLFPLGDSFAELKRAYLQNPEYIVCDRIGNALPFDSPYLAQSISNWEKNPRYQKIFEKENFIVFKRIQAEEHEWRIPQQTN